MKIILTLTLTFDRNCPYWTGGLAIEQTNEIAKRMIILDILIDKIGLIWIKFRIPSDICTQCEYE